MACSCDPNDVDKVCAECQRKAADKAAESQTRGRENGHRGGR